MPENAKRARVGSRLSRFHIGDILRLLLLWIVAIIGLALSAWILPGMSADGLPSVAAAALALGVVGALLRPLLVAGSVWLGWIGVVVAAFFAQALVVQVAISLVPGIESRGLGTALLAGIITGTLITLATWLGTAGTDEAFLTALVRQRGRGRRPEHAAKRVTDGLDGVVFVQLDGAPYPVVRWGVNAGTLPNLSRWMRSGSHQLTSWEAQIPCTTPVSQAGILHGRFDGIPAFRWFDRATGTVKVASKPADMAVTEARISDGRGLLADDGVSVGNIFSGDAPIALATMSRMGSTRDPGPAKRFAHYLTQPNGLFRSIVRSIAELGRDRYEAHRQRRLDIQPRITRTRQFALVRAATNGLLRDMNTALVADAMLSGARSIYVDLVDYDEIAHHAGPIRSESLHALENLDGVLGALEQVAEIAPRHYHFVVLSDHGQSQGETFADRYGETLGDVVGGLTGENHFQADDEEGEGWGRVDMLRSTVADTSGLAGKVADLGANTTQDRIDPSAPTQEAFVVLGSGNLALIYARSEVPLSLEELDERWPRLVHGLSHHQGIGFLVIRSAAGPVVLGATGRRFLDTDAVEGDDPLAGFGDIAADLRRALQSDAAPDIYVNSAIDDGTDEVAAFEELVGCHGGAGGWQTKGMLVAPAGWPIDQPLHGADAVHRTLVGWLEALGHRESLREEPAPS